MANLSSFRHVFQRGNKPDATPLLLLHGTGGSENDLLPLGQSLSPGASLLSPRGKVSEHGALRFFARLAEGKFDQKEVAQRTHELADFIIAAAAYYHFDAAKLCAVGFSNGANIAASLLLLRPETLQSAILIRPMVVLEQAAPEGSLQGKRTLILNGAQDPLVPPDHPERLATLLRHGGALVSVEVIPGTHALTRQDVAIAQTWISRPTT